MSAIRQLYIKGICHEIYRITMYKSIIRPILFLFQPETIHTIVFRLLKIGSKIPGLPILFKKRYHSKDAKTNKTVFGVDFPNPIGLAAGLDKDAEAFDMLGYMGFGFVEVGTVTPKPQPGNPKPRLFRLKKNKALINRMGFNNKGVDKLARKLRRKKSNVIIGANIGKNKLTPNDEAIRDYERCFDKLYRFVDYFVVNVSSPNTPGLRDLQDKKPLTEILKYLQEINEEKQPPKPILLKIAPDLTNEQLDDIIDIVRDTGIAGVVATNTTISRNNLSYSKEQIEQIGNGGLSGQPLKKRSTEVIRYIVENSNGMIPVIGVGGIMSPEDAIEKLEAGASLIQIYTSFIYEGPALVKKINKTIAKYKRK